MQLVLEERGITPPDGKWTKAWALETLSKQPDFAATKSLIAELIEGWREGKGKGVAGPVFICRFLPKFHCELNPIERVWGYAKLLIRERKLMEIKGETFADLVESALHSVPLTAVASFFRYSLRLMWAYTYHNSTYDIAMQLAKKFSRHREPLREDVQAEVDAILADQQAAVRANGQTDSALATLPPRPEDDFDHLDTSSDDEDVV
jgi:hypothetical protein